MANNLKNAKLIKHFLRREFSNNAVALFVAIFAILLTTQLIRLLNESASGKLPGEAIVALLGFSAVNYLPIVLSLTAYLAILLAISRAYRDSEMIICFSSGLPIYWFVRPVLQFVLPLVIVIAVLSLYLSPWALTQSFKFRSLISEKNKIAQVSPGDFYEMDGGKRVIFVENIASDNSSIGHIFISETSDKQNNITYAESGKREVKENGDQFVILNNGRSYEIFHDSIKHNLIEFQQMGVKVTFRDRSEKQDSPRFKPFIELINNRNQANLAEILWRFSLPISCLIISLLAIPLAHNDPRSGRSNTLILAIIIYAIYFNAISISKSWVENQILNFASALSLVHFVMLLIVPLWMFRQSFIFSWKRHLAK